MTQSTPTWFTVLLAILPVLSVLAGSFLTAWQNRAANKIALEQSKLQVEADLRKIQLQAEQEEKSRGLDEIIQRRQSEFETKNTANQRMIERLENLADAATRLHNTTGIESGSAYVEVTRYAGIARLEGFEKKYLRFVENSDDFSLLAELLEEIENYIGFLAYGSQTDTKKS